MKLRSAQFVLLVLLFSTLSLSEISSLRLADQIIGAATMTCTRSAARAQRHAQPHPAAAHIGEAAILPLQPARTAWTMRAPAAHAAALQAVTSYPGARAL